MLVRWYVLAGLGLVTLPTTLAWSDGARAGFGTLPCLLLFGAAVTVVSFALMVMIRVRARGDGLLFRRLLRRDWFVPYTALDGVSVDADRVRLRFRDGKIRHLHLRGFEEDGPNYTGLAFDLAEAIRRGIRASRGAQCPEEAVLRRGTRSTESWLQALERWAAPSGPTYRMAPARRKTLLEVAVRGSTEPTARAAAVWLLRRGGLESDERASLRAARHDVANPHVGEVLEVATWDVASAEDRLERLVFGDEVSARGLANRDE